MNLKEKYLNVPRWLVLTIIVICLGLLFSYGQTVGASNANDEENVENASNTLYIPVVLSNYRDMRTFGFESNRALLEGSKLLNRGAALDVSWARLGNRISWKDMQPNPGDAIDWSQAAQFEDELKALHAVGMTPLVIIQEYPHWAVDPYGWYGQPTSCGPLRADMFDEFAEFMQAVVNRYKAPMYNVHNWELGNEPDVDPGLLPAPDWGFGCWGDITDPFYGGRFYGEMIKVVGQAIKQADPTATVWLGGLLLDTPETIDPNRGKPELFLKGVLEVGAAPFFDVVGYHWYPPYYNTMEDHDLSRGKWAEWGGGTIGKAQFLRQTMEEYGVDKPVVLNETGLICVEWTGYCDPLPVSSFYEMQADNLIRSFVRGLSVDVAGFIWYTLNGPGWRHTGLLDENHDPHEAYRTYYNLSLQLKNARYTGIVDRDPGVEAYAFRRGSEVVQVAWTRTNTVIPILFPVSKFIDAYDRAGNRVTPILVGDNYQIEIRFTPTFVVLDP